MSWSIKPKSNDVEVIQLPRAIDENYSKLCCCASGCYFNLVYKGMLGCDLKNVIINKEGRCENFISKEEGCKPFHKKENGDD